MNRRIELEKVRVKQSLRIFQFYLYRTGRKKGGIRTRKTILTRPRICGLVLILFFLFKVKTNIDTLT